MFQAGFVHEIGEGVVCGRRHLVSGLLQSLAEAGERRDVTARTRGHDQHQHRAALSGRSTHS